MGLSMPFLYAQALAFIVRWATYTFVSVLF
jgi:hypothetical protein